MLGSVPHVPYSNNWTRGLSLNPSQTWAYCIVIPWALTMTIFPEIDTFLKNVAELQNPSFYFLSNIRKIFLKHTFASVLMSLKIFACYKLHHKLKRISCILQKFFFISKWITIVQCAGYLRSWAHLQQRRQGCSFIDACFQTFSTIRLKGTGSLTS
jgi:type II secretory pathway component PulF